MIMKNYIVMGAATVLALVATTSCNQNLLDIPQKGVIAIEDFYHSDEEAESALISCYAELITLDGMNGSNTPSWNALTRAPGDELYWGGGKADDVHDEQELNEFRGTLTNNNKHLKNVYKKMYAIIYKCNLLLDNFYGENGELMDSPAKTQYVAEARVIRAWCHFNLALLFYNPPLVEHVLSGDARPVNYDHDELIKWAISEFKLAEKDLPERKGPSDKAGAVRITKGACQAFCGKAQMFVNDYAGAKESLKKVISSNNYALTPTAQFDQLFHRAGDGNCEKVFEFNVVDNDNISSHSTKYHYQRNQSLFFRQLKAFPDKTIQYVGWGNNVGPTEKFVKAMLENEPNSARRKLWFISYEDLLTAYPYSRLDANCPTKEDKLMDPNRGLDFNKYDELYANCGYFWIKFLPYQSDLIHNNTTMTDENRIIMRYAEVLLMYAECCAVTNDNDGLKYLNMVQERAEAPLSTTLTLDAVKKEKWFELAWEGQRFFDLIRWGDAEKELAFKVDEPTPYLFDKFYVYGSKGKKQSGLPHEAEIHYKDLGFKALGGGFKKGQNDYYPIPFDILQINPELKQNPFWEGK